MMGAILQLDGVTVRYGRGASAVTAVAGVDLELPPGQIVGLVGESGCGKSTLARAICGLQPLAGGRITLAGEPIPPLGHRRRPARLLRIQMVFQNPYASLNPRRRVGDQIEDGRRVATRPVGSVSDLLTEVEMDASAADRFPHEFSGGQRQRIAIARAMAAAPDILIGDEPIASLDASLQSRIASLMRDVALRNDASLLFISHDLAVVREIADTILVMHTGHIVERGPAERVWAAPQDPYTRRLLAAIPIADGLGRIPG